MGTRGKTYLDVRGARGKKLAIANMFLYMLCMQFLQGVATKMWLEADMQSTHHSTDEGYQALP